MMEQQFFSELYKGFFERGNGRLGVSYRSRGCMMLIIKGPNVKKYLYRYECADKTIFKIAFLEHLSFISHFNRCCNCHG